MKRTASLFVLALFAMVSVAVDRAAAGSYYSDQGAGHCHSRVAHYYGGYRTGRVVRRVRTYAPPPPAPAPAPRPVIAPPPPPAPATGCANLYYPTGIAQTSAIHVSKCAPPEVGVGAPFNYTITVRNLTDITLNNVILTDQLAANYQFDSAQPAASGHEGTNLWWQLDHLSPRATAKFVVTGSATASGKLVNCVKVKYDLSQCLAINVTDPQISLTKTTEEEACQCDAIPTKLVVTNTGTGAARDVKIVDELPDGMTTSDGRNAVAFNVGTLAQGQSREFAFNIKAGRSGSFINTAIATAAGGLHAESTTSTLVTKPVLEITKTAPQKRYLNRKFQYDITVTNRGDGMAKNTVIEDPLPAGTRWVKASDGGQVHGRALRWNIGNLGPGQSRSVSVTVTASRIGDVRNIATARAYCADNVSAEAITSIQGIPAILLEVVDLTDPIEIGNETVYQITVTNQGSSPDTNITVQCGLEDQMQYVSSSGATPGVAEGQTIAFSPVPSLAPGAKASWRVRIKAVGTGDVRFTVNMNSDQLQRDVRETESTNFYE